MAVKITNNSVNKIAGLMELVADSYEELVANVSAKNCIQGSIAIIPGDDGAHVYMKDGKGNWKEL